jgi:bla regulator protein blaR1
MSSSLFWNEQWTAALVNHLWQSTIIAALALLLTFALRKNQARIRYWVWMIASVKFLLPFSLLMNAGQWMRSMIAVPIAKPSIATAIELAAQPFQVAGSFHAVSASASAHHFGWLPALLLAIWLCGVLVIAARWMHAWMSIRATVRTASPTEIAASAFVTENVPVLCSASLLEPGIFGILRPVLLLPKGIMERLQPEQLQAVLQHEMCHVRRRDNLTFALHMITQALFWFHPLTWWIGARLIEERERACDEAVLEAGGEAEVYAEGILSVCKFYVESPLACASGVSGSDLKNRVTRIMSSPRTHQLNVSRKLLLVLAGFAAVLLPLSMGLVRSALAEERAEDSETRLPKFEVASIKPHQSSEMMHMGMRMLPDGVSVSGLPLSNLLHLTFGLSDDRILNEPRWSKSDRFDIEAKVDPAEVPKMKDLTLNERWAMMLPVLQERYGLKFHRETRDLQVYTLVVAKGGSKLQPVQTDAPDSKGGFGRAMMRLSGEGMSMEAHGATMESLAHAVAQQIGGTVIDKTGLTGRYDYALKWATAPGSGSMGSTGIFELAAGPSMMRPSEGGAPAGGEPAGSAEPPLFTALQEQLGLKLVSQKVPVEVVVIDHIQQPSVN